MHVLCNRCRREVNDPGEPLGKHRCPACAGELIRLAGDGFAHRHRPFREDGLRKGREGRRGRH